MQKLEQILQRNKEWAQEIVEREPNFFRELANQQSPEILWIGCADSRVPANQIIDLPPGEVFVHRNIANVVVHSDLNCLSVLQYAIEVLHIKHVIVCGHYGCGGVKAAIENQDHGLIDNWLGHIQDVYRLHQDALDAIEDEQQKLDRLCELNVIEQVSNVCNSTIVRNAFKRGADLTVHGWIYSVQDGVIRDLEVSNPSNSK